MQAKIVEIEICATRNGDTYWGCSLDNGARTNIFNSNFGIFSSLEAVIEPLWDGNLGDKFKIEPSIPVIVAENQKGYLNIIRIKERPDGVKATKIVPVYLQDEYQIINTISANQQFKMLINHPDTVVFDFETTGTDTSRDEIVSVGVVSANEELERYFLVRPTEEGLQRNLNGGAIDIHHITNEMLQDKAGFAEWYDAIYGLLAGKIWVVYNSDYDVTLLDSICIRHGLELIPRAGVHCAMKLFAQYMAQPNDKKSSWKWHKLTDACEAMGVDLSNAHNALDDSFGTLHLMFKCAEYPLHVE